MLLPLKNNFDCLFCLWNFYTVWWGATVPPGQNRLCKRGLLTPTHIPSSFFFFNHNVLARGQQNAHLCLWWYEICSLLKFLNHFLYTKMNDMTACQKHPDCPLVVGCSVVHNPQIRWPAQGTSQLHVSTLGIIGNTSSIFIYIKGFNIPAAMPTVWGNYQSHMMCRLVVWCKL